MKVQQNMWKSDINVTKYIIWKLKDSETFKQEFIEQNIASNSFKKHKNNTNKSLLNDY